MMATKTSQTTESTNKDLVLEAFDIAPGRDGLFDLIKSAPATLKYESDMAVAEGDFVIVHGRYSGLGLAVNWIVADIVRIKDGVLVEHWDVIEDESTPNASKSGLSMFGDRFAA